jgi:hypothetical protein
MPRSTMTLLGALLLAVAGVLGWRGLHPSRVPELPPVRPPQARSEVPTGPSAAGATEPAPPSSAARGTVPDLPADAPKNVSFGVILITYRGAELAAADARTKESARELAKALAAEAGQSFEEAVKKGDRGSTLHAGTMPRGVLEPDVEYILFTLKKGQVYGDPVDTPRGYWVVRRND